MKQFNFIIVALTYMALEISTAIRLKAKGLHLSTAL